MTYKHNFGVYSYVFGNKESNLGIFESGGQQYCQFCTTGLPENVILAVLQHSFESNWPRAMIVVFIPMFSWTRNWMELFLKTSGQQYCQICTTGLPENVIFIIYKPVTGGDSYIPLEHMFFLNSNWTLWHWVDTRVYEVT